MRSHFIDYSTPFAYVIQLNGERKPSLHAGKAYNTIFTLLSVFEDACTAYINSVQADQLNGQKCMIFYTL